MNALEELVQSGGDIHRYFTDAEITSYKDFVAPLITKHGIDLVVEFVKYALILGLGWNRWLLQQCRRATAFLATRSGNGILHRLTLVMDRVWKGPGWGAAGLFVLAFSYVDQLLSLPEDLYFGWYRQVEVGLTHQSLSGFLVDLLRDVALHSIGLLLLGIGLYALMRWLPRRWWLAVGLSAIGGSLASGYADSSRSQLVYEKHPLEDGPVRQAVEKVITEAQVPVRDVLVINKSRETTAADAYFAGQGPTREIVIYDTMLGQFTPAEIAVAVAHEVGHLNETVISRKVIAAVVMVPLLYLFHLLLAWGARTGKLGYDSEDDIAGLPLLFLLWFTLTLASTPFSATSQRNRESDADAVALSITRDPDSFASLMTKLAKQNKADPIPDQWVETWLSSHPAVARRLAMAIRYRRDHPTDRPLIDPTSSNTVVAAPDAGS